MISTQSVFILLSLLPVCNDPLRCAVILMGPQMGTPAEKPRGLHIPLEPRSKMRSSARFRSEAGHLLRKSQI